MQYKYLKLFIVNYAIVPKGPALLKFLNIIKYHPKRVIFINDKEAHLLDVEKSVEEANMEFIGLRYSFCDPRVLAFQPEIADLQWTYSKFDHLLSDEEAEEILQKITVESSGALEAMQ